jgi:hypothetical protein
VRDFELRLQEAPSDREARKMHALALSHADRLTESLAEYDRLLAESPNDLDLQLNHARVLGWMGRNAQAAEAYREILKQHPGETQATLGAAQNENWAGNHRRAAALYEELLKSGRTDPEISKGLAYAYYWDGRPEESRTALDRYLAQQPADREGLELARMLSRDGSPNFSAGYQRSDDSDALRIRTTQFEYRMPLRGHSTLFARWRRDLVKDAGGNRDPLQVGGGLDKVWSRHWSTQLYLAWLRPERDVDADAVGELNVTLRPSDRIRIDTGFAKDQVLTRLSLAEGIMLRTATAGIDWQASERILLSLAQRWRAYSDGNRARHTSASAQAWVITQPHGRLAVLLAAERLGTDEDLDHGYYDPERYTEFGPGAVFEWHPADRWEFRFEGKVGSQKEKGSDADEFHSFTTGLEFPLGSLFSVNLEGGRSNSSLSATSGFKQNRWAATLTTRF